MKTFHYEFKRITDHPWSWRTFPHPSGGRSIDLGEYSTAYSGTIEGETQIDALERLFRLFNLDHPADYRGPSMSVGDIVTLTNVARDISFGTYYCDTVGWKKVSRSGKIC